MSELPRRARERLAEMRERRLFTSDFSVSEFLLVREAGFEPLGLVMGTSVYQIAPSVPALEQGRTGCELEQTTRALYHARELAMGRMEDEADALGADGIVGVRLTVNVSLDPRRAQWEQYRAWARWARDLGFRRPPSAPTAGWWPEWSMLAATQWEQWCRQMGWAQVPPPPWSRPGRQAAFALGPNTAEFIAVGTAVRHRDGQRFRNKRGRPFQSDLSGQDFWLLIRGGHRPVGFVMGNCVYYVSPDALAVPEEQSCELAAYAQALYDARRLAMERLEAEAEALEATGIVGVTLATKQRAYYTNPWSIGTAALDYGEVIEQFVIGTAVVAAEHRGPLGRATLVFAVDDTASGAPRGEGRWRRR